MNRKRLSGALVGLNEERVVVQPPRPRLKRRGPPRMVADSCPQRDGARYIPPWAVSQSVRAADS
jgi:hypothetical protein